MTRRAPLRAMVPTALLLLASLAGSLVPSSAHAAPRPAGDKADGKAKADAGGEEKSFDDVVKDLEVVKGLFTFYRKPDENKVLMEVLPAQMDTLLLFAATIDRSIGERGFYGTMSAADFPFTFHRSGKSVQWIQKNTRFAAEPGTPAARAVVRSFADAIVGSAKILSKPHPTRKSLLIDASELFVQRDLLGLGNVLNQTYDPTSFQFDRERSALAGVKGFEESALLDVTLHFTSDNPKVVSLTLTDARSVPIGLKYQLSTLPVTDYRPRLADERVGYFQTIQQDFTSDRPASPYVRRIARWNLEKTDPAAPLSPPKQPIVFWLENTIPLEYREPIAQGVLFWNKAFERIGLKDAIVVKQQPDSASWDPADTRYNTIRWFQGVDATFAIGPSRVNPYTGQIYDADISIAEGIVRYTRRAAEEFVGPMRLDGEDALPGALHAGNRSSCSLGAGLAQQIAFGAAVLEARGEWTPEMEERLVRESLTETAAHEVGHTLGLRHNFRGSTLLPPEELNDDAKTEAIGQTASVMDYNPIVIAPKGQHQGHFAPVTLGPYDYWAIEYGYKPIAGNDSTELAKIAERGSSDPTIPYSTDEDVDDPLPGVSIDPMAERFDQSSDPIAYARLRLGLVKELWGSLDTKLARPGEGYQVMRRALQRGLNDYGRSVRIASRFVGGIYHRRDHVGDAGGQLPFTPVPAVRQREALAFLAANAFGERAFTLPPRLHRELAVERLEPIDWFYYYNTVRLDYPWHDAVLNIQRIALDRVLSPVTLARVQDNELRFDARERAFRMADVFGDLDAAVWSELDAGKAEIPSLRRNLQREYLRRLIRIALRTDVPSGGAMYNASAPPPMPAMPEDATTLARASLLKVQGKIRRALAAKTPLDVTTRAHLQETQSRIAAALDARMERPVR